MSQQEAGGQENVAVFAMRILDRKRDPMAEDSEAEILARAVVALERSCGRLMGRLGSARNALFEIDDVVSDRHSLDRAACDLIRGAIELSREGRRYECERHGVVAGGYCQKCQQTVPGLGR